MSLLEQFAGQWFVVKIGGELALDIARLSRTVGTAIRQFLQAKIKVCLVHGGGPQATELAKRLGLTTTQVAGQRVTDEATLEVMKFTMGAVGVDVARAMRLANVSAIATTGVSCGLVDAKRRPPVSIDGSVVDYGLVGDVSDINLSLFESLAREHVVPIIGCLAGDEQGHVYNVNGDTVAARIASKLGAARLFLVSNVPGVLRDRNEPSSRIPTLTPTQARAHIASGIVTGGMIPKVEESLAMLEEGIGAVHIVSGTNETAILQEAISPGSCGTVFVHEALPQVTPS